MDANAIQRKAAETFLERGVRVPLPAPRFLRLFGKKTVNVVIRQPYLRTLFTASELALSDGFSLDGLDQGQTDAALELINKHSKTAARIVAVYFLNGKWKNRLFSKRVGSWLFSKLTNQKLLEITVTIVLMSRYQDFTSSIRLFKQMSLTTMMPKNLSPEEKGSQEAEQ
jgi:predicted neuraminidase